MRSALSTLLAISLASAVASAEPPQYQLVDIGSLRGLSTFATSLNERGEVVGYSVMGPAPPHSEPPVNAFLYRNGVMVDLFAGSTISVSVATAINDASHVVGYFRSDLNGPTQPFESTSASGVASLDPFDVGFLAVTGFATGINESGQIVGSASGSLGQHAFLLSPPATPAEDLTPVLPSSYFASSASAVNDAGDVVGILSKSGTAPLFDTSDSFLRVGSSLIDLDEVLNGQYMGANFIPSAINEAGVAVGYAYGPTLPVSAVTYEGGFFSVLEIFGGDRSEAHGIDSAGRVVGEATLPGDGTRHAFLWEEGQVYDLNDFVPAGSGMVLAAAKAINDQGQIVVLGHAASDPWPPQRWHSFLLTPQSPLSAIEELIELVEGMGLHHGIENSLTVKLEHALSAVAAGDDAGACDLLGAFINQVEAQTGKKIDAADAAILIEKATGVLGMLGCAP